MGRERWAVALLLLAMAAGARAETRTLTIAGEGAEEVRVVVVSADDELDRVGVWEGLLDPGARLTAGSTLRAGDDDRIAFDAPEAAALLLDGAGAAPVVVGPVAPDTVTLVAAVTVSGRVVDAAGEPVADARVFWLQEPAGNLLEATTAPLLGWTATTGENGAFSFEGVSPGPAVLVVRAGEDGGLIRENLWAPAEALELALPVPASATGVVRAETSGEPLPGALVRLFPGDADPFLDPFETETDEEGRWTLEGLPAARYTLDVVAEEAFLVEPRPLVLRAGDAREDVDVALRSFAALSGRVATVATDPIEGAAIHLIYPREADPVGGPPDPWTPVGHTDAAGRFTIERLPPQANVTVVVRHPEHATARFERAIDLEGAVTAELAPVLLDPGLVVAASVVERREGEDVAVDGVAVAVVPIGEDATSVFESGRSVGARRGVTGDEGTVRVGGLAPGRYRLVARSRTSRITVGEAFDVTTEEPTPATLRLSPGARILGVVAGPDRAPVAGAGVRAVDAIGTELAAAESAEDGSFALLGLEPGEVSVVVEGEGFQPARVDDVVTGRHLRVTLEPLGAIAGRVRAAEEPTEESPLPGFTLGVHRWTGADALGRHGNDRLEPVWFGRRAGGDGAFEVPDLQPGRYRLEVELADGRSGVIDSVGVASGETTSGVEIRVVEGGAITGQVVDAETGRPIEGASVRLVERGIPAEGARLIGETDEMGVFRLEHVPPGRRTIEVRARDHAPLRREGIEVFDGLVERIDGIELGAGASVEIEAIARTGAPLAGATFTIEDATYGLRRTGTTDLDGVLIFDGLPAGGHRIEGRGGTWTVSLERDEVRRLPVDLAGAASVEGRITRAGRPVPGMTVEAFAAARDARLDRHVVRDTTNEDGAYALDGLTRGRWHVQVRPAGEGFVPVRRSVVVEGERVSPLDFELPDGGISGELIDDQGDPVAGGVLVLRRARGGEVGRTATDGEGAFGFVPLTDGTYRIEAHAEGHGAIVSDPIAVNGARGDPESVRLRLARAGTIVGRLQALRDRRPLGEGWVIVRDVADRAATLQDRVRVDQEGRFRLDSLAAGRYVVYAEAPGFGRAIEAPVHVLEGGESRISFLLEEEAVLEVRVFGPGGRPVRSAEVELRDHFGRRVWPVERGAFGPPDLDRVERPEWLTDAAGRVVVRNLGPGLHIVHARRTGLEPDEARIVIQVSTEHRIGLVLKEPE